MDNIYKRLEQAVEEFAEQFQPVVEKQRGQLGYVPSADYSVRVPNDNSKYYVRLDNKSFIEAYHKNMCAPKPDLFVYVAKNEKDQYEIVGLDYDAIKQLAPNNAGNMQTGPHSHDRFSGMAFPVDSRLLGSFQMRPTGALNLYINPGAYEWEGQWRYFNGELLNLSANVPSSTNSHRWVLICLDPVTGLITVINGASKAAASPLQLSEIENIVPRGIPVGAVRLRNGQGSISEIDMEALHILVHGYPKNNYSATTNPQATDDELDGYNVGSVWIDINNSAIYICTDATTGNAVWVSGGSGGAPSPILQTKTTLESRILIHEETLSSNGTFTFSVGANDNYIEIEGRLRGSQTGGLDTVYLIVNGDTTLTNYRANGWFGSTTNNLIQNSTPTIGYCSVSDSQTGAFSPIYIKGFELRATNGLRHFMAHSQAGRSTAGSDVSSFQTMTRRNSDAVTSLQLRLDGGSDNFLTGSFIRVYRIVSVDVVTDVSGTTQFDVTDGTNTETVGATLRFNPADFEVVDDGGTPRIDFVGSGGGGGNGVTALDWIGW